MPKYRKKPVIIEAFQMTIARRWDNSEWPNWLHAAWQGDIGLEGSVWINDGDEKLVCGAFVGAAIIDWDDWIIKSPEGEIYPCKSPIFEKTYEKVEPEYQAQVERLEKEFRLILACETIEYAKIVARTALGQTTPVF